LILLKNLISCSAPQDLSNIIVTKHFNSINQNIYFPIQQSFSVHHWYFY